METPRGLENLQQVFDFLPEGILVTDFEDRVILVNPMATILLGVPASSLIGHHTEDISRSMPHLAWMFDDEHTRHLPCWEILGCGHKECSLWGSFEADCWASGTCPICRFGADKGQGFSKECVRCDVPRLRYYQREKEFHDRLGHHTVLQVSCSRIRTGSQEAFGKLFLLRDVTKERELTRMKDDFLSIISHELRTPLTSIRSYSEILAHYTDTDFETQKEFLRIIVAESEKLDHMIEEIGELRRLEAKSSVWTNRVVSLTELFDKAIADRTHALETKGISWSVSIDPTCPPVWVDFDKMLQVVRTLLRIVEKHAPPHSKLHISACPMEGKRERDPGTIAYVTISCTWAALHAEDHTLELGKKGELQPPVDMKKGEGIGFLLCKKILDQYGGNLWTETEPSMNTYAFHFTLPSSSVLQDHMEETEPRERQKPQEQALVVARKSPEIEKSKKRVLVVDDDPSIVNALVFALTREGYNVRSATSAKKALEIVSEIKPDLIISDISMPEMNGYEFFKHLQSDETTKMIPFIFASAKDEPTDLVLGFKTGVDDYLCKPFKIPELLARIERLLSRVEMYKDLARYDSLTGALTRRSFEEALEKELQRAIVTGQPLSVVMTDLDRFKNINDTYGHIVGDFVLSSFVNFLRKNLRDEDIVARYGGEEFFIIMPDVGKHKAVEIIERIRKSLNDTSFYYEKDQFHLRITSSFGLSGFPEDGASFPSLILKADQALYCAKRLGRNQVIPYTEHVKMDGSSLRVG